MPHDDHGNKIKEGDKLSFVVGIPGRDVVGTVVKRRGRLVVTNDEGSMSLAETLKWYNCEVIKL